jgi:hypothetical protein
LPWFLEEVIIEEFTISVEAETATRSASGELFWFERLAALPAEEVARAAAALGKQDDITVSTLRQAGAPVSA